MTATRNSKGDYELRGRPQGYAPTIHSGTDPVQIELVPPRVTARVRPYYTRLNRLARPCIVGAGLAPALAT